MMSLAARIAELGIKGAIKYTGSHMEGRYSVNDWKVTLRAKGKQYTFPMTSGDLAGEPTVEEAFNCIVLDARCYFTANDFRDFCDEFGWDIDSDPKEKERARKAYDGCSKAYDNLVRMFGNSSTKDLIYETESL